MNCALKYTVKMIPVRLVDTIRFTDFKFNQYGFIVQLRYANSRPSIWTLRSTTIYKHYLISYKTTQYKNINGLKALHTILRALSLCSTFETYCAKYHEEHGDILKDMDDFNAAEEGNYTSAEYHYKEAYKLDSSPPVLLDNMRKLQRRLFTVQENTCWRTDTSCTDSSVILMLAL
ncbi:UNVERIFIED_CONTAM: hypothetical protein NCL1_28715 [Trichonephila clavipes]